MAQYEILDLLEKTPYKWYTSNQVAKILGLSQSTVSINFFHLRKMNLVRYKKPGMSYIYRWKNACIKD